MKFVIDTFAWIEYFNGSESGKKVSQIIELEENEVFSSIITIAEVASILRRNEENVELGYKKMIDLSKLYFINSEFAKEAGILHAEIRKEIKDFGLADAFVLLTARKLEAKIVTGDPHFKKFKEAILI